MAAEVSERTARKWVRRYRAEGEPGLGDRSSAPARQPNATSEQRVEAIAALRRLRMAGAEIAQCLGMALSTAQGILTRVGLGKLSRLEPPEPPEPRARTAAKMPRPGTAWCRQAQRRNDARRLQRGRAPLAQLLARAPEHACKPMERTGVSRAPCGAYCPCISR